MRIWAGVAIGALIVATGGQTRAQTAETPAPAPVATEIDPNTQEAPAEQAGVTSYPTSFFAAFRPTNATEMVQIVPGFNFESGENVRGFAGAAGNVLIDGQRPTSKSTSLNQLLQRIPADQVIRIDLIRGGAPGIDMQGQPVVANIIRKTGASLTRNLTFAPRYFPAFGFTGYVARLDQSLRSGPFSMEAAISARRDKNGDSGEGKLVRKRANGAIFEQGDFDSDFDTRQIGAQGGAEYRQGAATYRLNGSLDRNDQDRRELAQLTDSAGRPFSERSRTKTRADKAEIGGDYERGLTDELTFRLLGLKTFKADKQTGLLVNRNPTQLSNETSTSGETIVRSTLAAVPSDKLQIEAGAEGALNFLDARSTLVVGGAPVVLPSANVRVEEKRGEGFVTVTSKWGALSLETAARYEASRIKQTGGANQSRSLTFLKPRVFATYSRSSTTLRLRFERVVGQLNFKDFAATAELDAGTANAGNPNLEPERSWLYEAAIEQRFWGGGALVLTARHEALESVVDLIPIAGRFDAPGNIGDGKRDEFKASLSLPLDKLGLAGVMVRGNATWRDSSVIDPVTGLERRISLQRAFEGDFQISKTAPALRSTFYIEASASGQGSGSGNFHETSYRISEIRTNSDQPVFKLIWDWTPRPSTAIRFQMENALGKDRIRERILFTGPRSLGVVNYTEKRNAHLGPIFVVRLRQRL